MCAASLGYFVEGTCELLVIHEQDAGLEWRHVRVRRTVSQQLEIVDQRPVLQVGQKTRNANELASFVSAVLEREPDVVMNHEIPIRTECAVRIRTFPLSADFWHPSANSVLAR